MYGLMPRARVLSPILRDARKKKNHGKMFIFESNSMICPMISHAFPATKLHLFGGIAEGYLPESPLITTNHHLIPLNPYLLMVKHPFPSHFF